MRHPTVNEVSGRTTPRRRLFDNVYMRALALPAAGLLGLALASWMIR